MINVFMLSDYKSFVNDLTRRLNLSEGNVVSLPIFEEERSWHDWTTELFEKNEIGVLIIPISIPTDNPINTDGLKIAMHIRLNYELSLLKRLIPIIFLSDFNMENIIKKNNFDTDSNPQNLLFTKACYLCSFDETEILETIKNAESCSSDFYQKHVLNKLNVTAKESFGKHSVANAWGCFKLAQVTGLRKEIFKHEAVSAQLKTLYSKYLICSGNAYKKEEFLDFELLKCTGKKVLFIDDQADEGWGYLMKNVFKGALNNFSWVDSGNYKNKETKFFHDFDGFMSECRSHIGKDWDLIIIDLRLNPEKEDIDNEIISPTDFYGYKLIDEFLTENEGYQIIVSTASNKIWNISAALERGVSSYYVKESPEFSFTVSETKKHFKNFKHEIVKCFEKSYLRDIYSENKKIILKLNNLNSDFANEIQNQLTLSYSLLNSAKSEVQFAYAYISLYMIIEMVNNEFYTKTSDYKWEISGVGNLLDWKWDNLLKKYSNTSTDVVSNKPPEWQKFAGIYYQKWNMLDDDFIQKLYYLITKRNGFVHKDKVILDMMSLDGDYFNRDVFKPNGFIELHSVTRKIIDLL